MELIREREFSGYVYSTDPKKIDLDFVHHFLSNSYWAAGIPKSIVKQFIEHSISVDIYTKEAQIGLARLITDYATFGYLADVFVDGAYRGRGLSKKLMEFILSFHELIQIAAFWCKSEIFKLFSFKGTLCFIIFLYPPTGKKFLYACISVREICSTQRVLFFKDQRQYFTKCNGM